MKLLLLILAGLLGLPAPALAQTRPLPQGEIRSNGDITFGNALKLGKRDGNKTIITPDALEILGPGSSGDGSGFSASPSDGRAADTLAKLLGRTSERFFPENYGALANGGDDGDAIIAALNAAAPVKGVVALRGKSYGTSKTLNVPSNVTLLLEGASLNVLANVNVVRLKNRATLDGYGEISVTRVPGFSEAAVEINGDDSISFARIAGAIRLVNSTASKTGVGYRLTAAGTGASRIDYVDASFAAINNFAIGVHYKATGTAFVNSNYLNAWAIYGCLESIVTETDGTAGAGYNFFKGSIQPATDKQDAVRALRLASTGNQVDMMIWDWHMSANPKTAITFSPGSSRNVVRSPIGPDRVEDFGSSYRYTANQIIDWYNQAPIQRSVLPPTMRFQTFAGNQDDIFAFADKHPGWTVTQTAGSPPTAGAIASVFDLIASNSATWNSASTFPVSIEVDFGGALSYFMGMGVAFNFGGVPSNVLLETYNGTTWTTRKASTVNGAAVFSYQEDNFAAGVSKARVTFSGPPAGGSISLERIFGFAANTDGGYAYRPRLSTEAVFIHSTVPPTPPAGYVSFYRGATGKLRWKESTGAVYEITGTPIP